MRLRVDYQSIELARLLAVRRLYPFFAFCGLCAMPFNSGALPLIAASVGILAEFPATRFSAI